MVTDTFFDLQRFDGEAAGEGNEAVGGNTLLTATGNDAAAPADTLVGGVVDNNVVFAWQNGNTFVNDGTEENPVYHLDTTGKGTATVQGPKIAFDGTKDGYSFATNEDKDNWSVSVKGAKNVVSGDFSTGTATYGLNGEVEVDVLSGKAFDEKVNGESAYVKASVGNAVKVGVSADGTGAMKYTFDNVNGAGVGVDGNDVAVFKGNSTNVSVGSAASEDSMIAADIDFNGDATVVSNANDSNVSIKVMEGTTVEVDGEKWEFDNKSSREVSEIVINKDGDVSSVSATKSVRLIAAGGIENPVSVNIDGTVATWNEITGDITSENDATGKFTVAAVSFDKIGARVNNTGAATVKSASGERVAFSTLTAAGVVANDVTIKAVAGSFSSFAVDLDTQSSGIEGIAIDEEDVAVNVAGDKEFEVKVGKVDYAVATSADNITFDVETLEDEDTRYTNDALALVATVASGKDYTVTGGDAEFITNEIARGGKASFGINGATVEIKNSSVTSNFYHISTDDASEGVDVVGYLKMNDEVNVTNDSDGYRVAYYKDEGDFNALDVVTFTANGAKISAYAGIFGTGVDNAVLITANASGTEVTVQGIPGNAVVSVASGATYHFKNSLSKNEVTVGGAEYTEVTLTAGGDVITNPVQGKVSDLIDDTDIPRKNADQAKWSERATVGGSAVNGGVEDTVVSNHASVYSDFYALDKSGVAANTVAGYANQDDTVPTETKQAINIEGETNLGGASHVTISGNSEIGQVPINIQSNENPNVVDVTVDLTASNVPSSIAVGTTGNVSASHDIRLSTAGTQNTPSYGYLGRGATGENKLSATAGSNLLRHDGTNRTSIAGGMNNDTIRGDVNDVVTGGAGADYFYDYTGYATDYQVGEGDVIIASRLASLDEVTAANIRGQGNQIGFGNGEYLLTLGNIDQNEQVHVKVAVMDNDGNVVKGVRDVVLANSNGFVDATAAGDNGALVIANASRDNSLGSGVHVVVGSSGKDAIHVGNYDTVSGAGGNDSIQIDQGALGVVVTMSEGFDSVSGWNFGFDKAAGKTQLITSGLQPRGRMFEDKLLISLEGGATISFEDTKQFANHGQYDVLVNNEKYTAIRNGDANKLNEASLVNPDNLGYAYVNSNDNIADYYLSEREGWVIFDTGVTDNVGKNLGTYGEVDLNSENFQYIRRLTLNNNSKTIVYGSADRETVTVGGAASAGANKVVSLGGGNDIIYSGGDGFGIASHTFMFGAGDGRDSVFSYNHYQGVNEDPDKQTSDLIAFQSLNSVKVEVDEDKRARVEFVINENDQAVVYEDTNTYDYNRDMYLVQIGAAQGVAKIGYSNIANTFSYDKEVDYYVGSSGEARDTLVINATNENVEVRMDGQKQDGKFYRGIGVIDASAASYTNTTLAGSAADNMIIAGGEGTNNFLWGGAGTNTLIGGAGKDFFLYTKNANAYVVGADHSDTSGTNDLIAGYDCNNDVIILSDVTLADINYAGMLQAGGTDGTNCGITENGVTVALNNGGSVTVDPTGQEKVTFYINDGAGNLTAFSANRDTGTWSRG